MSVVKIFSSDYHVFVFISALIDVWLLSIIFKRYSVSFALSFAVFMAFSLILEVNLMRNIKSILLFLLALPYLEKRKFIPYVLMIAAAMLFHSSAIIYIPLYFVLARKYPEKWIIAVLGIGLIIYLLQLQLWRPLIAWFIDTFGDHLGFLKKGHINNSTHGTGRGITQRIIESVLLSVWVLSNYKRLLGKSSENVIFLNLFFLYQVVYLYFSEIAIIVDRVGNLFMVSYWIIIPALICRKRHFSYGLKRFNWYFVRILIILYMFMILAVRTNNILYDYDNVLFNYKSYENRRIIFHLYAVQLLKD